MKEICVTTMELLSVAAGGEMVVSATDGEEVRLRLYRSPEEYREAVRAAQAATGMPEDLVRESEAMLTDAVVGRIIGPIRQG